MAINTKTNVKTQRIQAILEALEGLHRYIPKGLEHSILGKLGEDELEDLTRHLQDALGVFTTDYEPADHDTRQIHFRCVRVDKYPPGTPETSMQGHYMWADDEDDARRTMVRNYPGERIIVRRCATPDTGD